MPIYDYRCKKCHTTFTRGARYDDVLALCECGEMAQRSPIYMTNNIIAGQSLPRRDDAGSIQEEYGKEVKKRGWSKDRAIEELRANRFTDAEGQMRIDTSKMTQTA